jgi:uncharacterized membrane protein (DUF4010 family)
LDTFELIGRLAIALAIGLIIGVERGWKQRKVPEGDRAAGLRTHTLSALLGGVWGALALHGGNTGLFALALAFVAFSATIAVFRYREMVRDGTYGATTVVGAMLAFGLGALAVIGDVTAAAAAGVATALLLALKAATHEWLKRLTWEELRAGLVLLAMTVILLPLLPDRELAPWFPVNPRAVWLLTIMIAALSFAGYVAIRLAGDRLGVLLSGIAGGLVSSTAITLNMARLARKHPGRERLFVAAILLASATMMLRVVVIAGLVNAALLPALAVPLVFAALAQGAVAAFYAGSAHGDTKAEGALALRNPFDFGVVLEFGALLALIMALAKWATIWAGARGTIALAAVSGLVDVDAISISLARLAPLQLDAGSAVLGLIVAVASNSLAKLALAVTAGGLALGRLIAWGLAAAFAAGIAGYTATLLF